MIKCLGKTAARTGAISLRFSEIFRAAKLPTPPPVFGHQAGLRVPWGMLANDQYGDCVWAGAAHETMLWESEGATPVASFTDQSVLADYAVVTGFVPSDPATDQGTDMQQAAAYRQKVGVIDGAGARHKIAAYMALRTSDVGEIVLAAYLLGAAGFGLQFPSSAEDQFDRGEPWSVILNDRIEGGHYVPVVGRAASGNLVVVTWGRTQETTPEFYEAYNDESVAYMSTDMISQQTKKSPEGFDAGSLQEFLKEIGQ